MRLMVHSPSNEATAHRYPQFSRNINIDRSLQVSIRTIGQNWSIRRLRIVLSFWGEIWDRIGDSTGFEWFWVNFSVLRVIFRTGPAKINSIYVHKSLSWRENSFRPRWMLWCRLFIDLSKLCNKINQQIFYFNKKSDPDRNDGTDMKHLIRSLKICFSTNLLFWDLEWSWGSCANFIRVCSRVSNLYQTMSQINSSHSSSGSCINLMNSCQPS